MQIENKAGYIGFPRESQRGKGRDRDREKQRDRGWSWGRTEGGGGEKVEHLVSPDYPNVSRYVSTLTFSIRRIKRRRIRHCKATRQAKLHRSISGQVARNVIINVAHDDIVAVIIIIGCRHRVN